MHSKAPRLGLGAGRHILASPCRLTLPVLEETRTFTQCVSTPTVQRSGLLRSISLGKHLGHFLLLPCGCKTRQTWLRLLSQREVRLYSGGFPLLCPESLLPCPWPTSPYQSMTPRRHGESLPPSLVQTRGVTGEDSSLCRHPGGWRRTTSVAVPLAVPDQTTTSSLTFSCGSSWARVTQW